MFVMFFLVNNVFPFNDQVVDPTKMSNVVYFLKCNDCDASYIVKSTRICNKRMAGHNNYTARRCHTHKRRTVFRRFI